MQKLLASRWVGYRILESLLVDFNLFPQVVQFSPRDRDLLNDGWVDAVAGGRCALAARAVARALNSAYVAAIASIQDSVSQTSCPC